MKIFVTGACGQLGSDVMHELAGRGHTCTGSDILGGTDRTLPFPYIRLDITDKKAVAAAICRLKPEAVIHCAAWTAVDLAEEESQKARVYAINTEGTRYVAEACRVADCKMLYTSTDYVFNGQGTDPWQPDCSTFAPLNVYGDSKLKGEQAAAGLLEKFFIVRIAWVFGLRGSNFVKTMLGLGKKHDTLRVVDDQIGTPTYTPDLARLLADMVETDRYGYYHATNEGGYTSWYGFACEIFRQAGYNTRVVPVTTEEYGLSRARRPFNSRLDKAKLVQSGFSPLPDWKDALARYLKGLEIPWER